MTLFCFDFHGNEDGRRMKLCSKIATALIVTSMAGGALAEATVIHAGHLIAEPGRGVKSRQSVIVEDGKIVAIKDGFVPGANVIDLKDAWVFPGLIDMHTHISGELNLDLPADGQILAAMVRSPAVLVLEALPRAKLMVMSGFTTIRNVGDPTNTTYALRDAINRGDVVGPRMFAIEPQISLDGGDYDASKWGARLELEPFLHNRGNCTGVVECTKVVREEVNRGADVIKFRQNGAPVSDPRISTVESDEEIRAIIDTAHRLDRRVAVHVNGTPTFLHEVIADGADTIEHGPLDDAAIELMKKHGTAYTPTLLAAKLVDYRFKEASEGTGKAYRAGVPIIYGTDLGIMSIKRSHEEFTLLNEAGLPPEQVLRAATMNAATALGRADSLGSIAPGKLADIVAMKVDPLTHIGQVGDEEFVTFVMKEGRTLKGGGQ
jgi:imidazolonepropionase-like amidohydrolase